MFKNSSCIALLFTIIVGCKTNSISPPSEQLPEPQGRTRLVMLGTGTPNADPDRSGPALAIVVDDRAYLVDCGPGIVRRAAAAAAQGIDALKAENLHHVFLTHLHTDHTLGLPDLIYTPWVLERDQPLQIFGPIGTRTLANHLQEAWSEDKTIRLDGLEPANAEGYKTEVTEINAGVVYEDELVTVTAFAVPHGSWQHAFGFRFDTPDRVIVISGDTAPSEELIRIAEGCDTLVHEVYSSVAFESRPDVWKAYHSVFHTSSIELAEIASKIQPKLLVLTHQLFWGRTEEQLLDEFKGHYDGDIVSANDLDIL
ncbi:MAG: ribonuclease BN (tRNA processing enzyme) [Planctomycetota bacterium]|jgi:ribonuclease BN (tRNA processing enzyme)